MTVRAAFWGMVAPASSRLTVANETPSRSASFSCGRSSPPRMARRMGLTERRSVMSLMYVVKQKRRASVHRLSRTQQSNAPE